MKRKKKEDEERKLREKQEAEDKAAKLFHLCVRRRRPYIEYETA